MSGVGMDPTFVVRVKRWRAACECGWVGPDRETRKQAEADADAHDCELC